MAAWNLSRTTLQLLVLISGIAGLSWEVVWQLKVSLALGVSAWGAALTLAVTMGGLSVGSFLMGAYLRDRPIERPAYIYAILECLIGVFGLMLGTAFYYVEILDTQTYATLHQVSGTMFILSLALTIGLPALCMGATLPVLGLMARQYQTSIGILYGLNTLGAAAGALLAALVFMPMFGLTHTAWLIAGFNFFVALVSFKLPSPQNSVTLQQKMAAATSNLSPRAQILIVLATGFATFMLEVAWFRSLTSAFKSTTDTFAIMLAAVLICLWFGSFLSPLLRAQKRQLGVIVGMAGIFILLITPIIERFDLIPIFVHSDPYLIIAMRFALILYTILIPMTLLGIALPWILDDQNSPRRWSKLYALNALAAIIGALSAAWIFLPLIGFAKTAWIAGVLVLAAGLYATSRAQRPTLAMIGLAALTIAIIFESGVGTTRVQGWIMYKQWVPKQVLESYEGPDATTSAVEFENGLRALLINGFTAATQSPTMDYAGDGYMAWMGHVPMMLHPNPKNAMVICFGTGQTSNAVRQENPESLDIVDINPRVFQLAHNFPANEGVLNDPRVHPIVMDGRAYMRRSDKQYDVITLEPMPPTFAGNNSLYSKEFYEFAAKRLNHDGIIAQWLPFHLVAPRESASIAKTFQSVFPNSVLWIYPDASSGTGILVGTRDMTIPLGTQWPGFDRTTIKRNLPNDVVQKSLLLTPPDMERYGAMGEIITDDNQMLAYGKGVYAYFYSGKNYFLNHDIVYGLVGKTRPPLGNGNGLTLPD